MNAEALIGTVLGTSTLQQLVGQGGMGAVYLAQQSRPRRQVAVKVLMPATALKPHQLSAFLERFRRETDAAASLEHPNIMPVYEYGERGGLAYLVMPYISAGTLRDVMERDGQMTFGNAMNYLEQMAAALDFAHVRGVIHRDIKPANMLLTPDGRLLLTDFGLVKILSDNQSEQIRLTGAGAPVGTPDYMSPEQVIGSEVDGRADQYSLGVVLFQMLTGTTPFQGETPMQIASQQLHMQPPVPRSLRPDLPEVAEQVLLRAMAKRPEERFSSCQEFAAAFRAMLTAVQPGITQNRNGGGGGLLTNAGMRKGGGLFDPKWQSTGTMAAFGTNQFDAPAQPLGAPAASLSLDTGTNVAMPRPGGTGLLSRTGLFPRIGDNTGAIPAATNLETTSTLSTGLFPTGQVSPSTGSQQAVFGQTNLFGQPVQNAQQNAATQQADFQSSLFAQPDPAIQQAGFQAPAQTGILPQPFPTGNLQQLSPAQSTTSALTLFNAESKGNTIKLTGAVKVVQVPVAPGQYVTGLLPVQKEQEEQNPEKPAKPGSKIGKIVLSCVVLVFLCGSLGGSIFWLTRAHNGTATPPKMSNTTSAAPNPTATALARATGTADANIIFSDPLSQNIHNFPEGNNDGKQYTFENGTYHILNNSTNGAAVVVQETFSQTTLAYQITMEEIKGDDTSPNNTFGMILRYNTQTSGGNSSSQFYTFEVLNEGGSAQYGFYKYDSSQSKPWGDGPLWSAKVGNEFHEGQGSNAINTIKVFADGNSFTFYVNGQKVGTKTDGSLKSGSMGMLVNLKGTEVAFSNMLITLS